LLQINNKVGAGVFCFNKSAGSRWVKEFYHKGHEEEETQRAQRKNKQSVRRKGIVDFVKTLVYFAVNKEFYHKGHKEKESQRSQRKNKHKVGRKGLVDFVKTLVYFVVKW
jgi:Ni,Fe-hydrogenase III component G